MHYGPLLKIALRNLGRNRGRTLAAVLTVASGVVAFLLAGGYINWVFVDMREATIHSQLGHIQIVRPQFFDKGIATPYEFLLPADGKEQSTIRNLPGFVSLAPRLTFSGLINRDETTIAFSGEGIDPVAEKPITTRITLLAGREMESSNEKSVMLGEGLANNLGAKPGDTVVLLTSTASGSASALEVTVAGIFGTITKEYDDYALRLPIEQARKLMRVNSATSWVVVLDGWQRTDPAVASLGTALPSSKFEVVPWHALSDFYNKTVELFKKQVHVVRVIIGLIIVLTISNTLTMAVLERTTEIGTSLAIGLRRSTIMKLFIIEGCLIGLLGGLIGLVLGFVLAEIISAIGIPMPAAPGMAHGYIAGIIISPQLAIDAFILAIVTTLLASAFPAWKAGRMNIVDALRYSQ
jgi:putative ABC transport system permease protein